MSDLIDFDAIDEHGPETYEASFAVSPDEVNREEVTGLGDVSIRVSVDQGDREGEYVADGMVTFGAELSCSRCLEPYSIANRSSFHVRFRPRPEASEENEEVEITDKEEFDVEFYANRTIPLRDLALEQVQLSLPMKPLCDENCVGLCPVCGTNRTRETCSCRESVVDERWGALQEIRQELSKKTESS